MGHFQAAAAAFAFSVVLTWVYDFVMFAAVG